MSRNLISSVYSSASYNGFENMALKQEKTPELIRGK
jgi:hypothetical protein